MLVTVAICTWNRCELLRQTLAQLTQIVVPEGVRWELLVVDNNCTDETPGVLAAFATRLPLRVVRESSAGLSHARNRALDEAAGDLILWTDDDVLVDEGWLMAFVDVATRYPNAAGFGGPIEPWFINRPDAALCEAFPWLPVGFCGLDYGSAMRPLGNNEPVWGANMGFRRSSIEGLSFRADLGPTPTSAGGGDESDFQRQLRARGGVIVWNPEMRLKHFVPPARMTLEYLTHYASCKGSEQVRLYLSADQLRRGKFLMGAPRWLWKEYAFASLGYYLTFVGVSLWPRSRLRSGPTFDQRASTEIRRLVWLRERSFLAGIFGVYRSMRIKVAQTAEASI